jgi:outer membrane protein assembly factor BamB
MWRTRLICGLVSFLGLLPHPAYSQIKAGDWAISPWIQNMVVGESSPLQILDDQWRDLAGAQWSVSDDNLAQIYPDEQRKNIVIVQALAPGEVTLRASLNGQTHSITVNIWPEHLPPDHHVKWDSIAFGKGINEVKAMRYSLDQPALYMASQAGSIVVVHAVDMDGLQYWSWIIPESQGNAAKLLCADDHGGIIVKLQRAHDYVIYDLSASGELKWTYVGRDKLQSHALGYDETLYLVEAGPGHVQVKLVALDGTQGEEKFSHSVPESAVTRINLAREAFLCIAGFHVQVPQAAMFSRLLVNTDGNAYFAFTVTLWNLQGVNCTPETALHAADIRQHHDNSLFLWKISPDGALVSTLVQRDQGENRPPDDLAPLTLPTGDLIPDGDGGVLLAVRQVPARPLGSPVVRHDYVYRITDEGKLAYKLALPDFAGLRVDDGMVLNDENQACTTIGGVVLCFNSISGKELWRYDTGTAKVTIVFAAEDGSVVAEDSNRHMLALDKYGKKTTEEDFNPARQVTPKLPD